MRKGTYSIARKSSTFLIDNQEERDYLPWCIIAANLYPLEKHTRKIYSEYCRCSEELQNEILNQAGYKIKQFTGKYWLQGCIDKLQQDIEKYNLEGIICMMEQNIFIEAMIDTEN